MAIHFFKTFMSLILRILFSYESGIGFILSDSQRLENAKLMANVNLNNAELTRSCLLKELSIIIIIYSIEASSEDGHDRSRPNKKKKKKTILSIKICSI